MSEIKTERLAPIVAERIKPFLEEILKAYSENIHSFHVTGSAVTEDFNEKTSNINGIFVLKEMDLKFIEFLAPLGKKYKQKGIAAPLIMTPEYVESSIDVFPIEFLDFKLIHETVLGKDILENIEIKMPDLRHQCERELKIKLIGLRQGYISSLGDKKMLIERFADSITGYMPLFRGIIFLMNKVPPVRKRDVLSVLAEATGVDTNIFMKMLDIRNGKLKPNVDDLKSMFEDYYHATEKIGKLIDEHKI